jgi:hypothetical protein
MIIPFRIAIPARYASTRLPGKPLRLIAGRSMIEHVYRRALASGAQFISTDYPEANPAFSPYAVHFEDGIVVRINPVNGDPSLRGVDLEGGRRGAAHRQEASP